MRWKRFAPVSTTPEDLSNCQVEVLQVKINGRVGVSFTFWMAPSTKSLGSAVHIYRNCRQLEQEACGHNSENQPDEPLSNRRNTALNSNKEHQRGGKVKYLGPHACPVPSLYLAKKYKINDGGQNAHNRSTRWRAKNI
jgi:hypothetical protein